VTYRKISTR